ncbi:MAG: type II secretion system F family protein [Candidatus Micrarchaeota archaeon]
MFSYNQFFKKIFSTADVDISVEKFSQRVLLYSILFGLALALFLGKYSEIFGLLGFFTGFLSVHLFFYALLLFISRRRATVVEELLPDFLALMAANIRSGMTPDRALLLSSRKELGPLANEIDKAAKKSLTGAPLDEVFLSMSERIDSDLFSKTIDLIVQGVRSGGNLGLLLERTSFDLRRFAAVRKEVQATVLIYEIFIFFATAIGAPVLYGISTVLVEVISKLKPAVQAPVPGIGFASSVSASGAGISVDALIIFSVLALFITNLFGSMAMGAIYSGKKIDGIKYFPIMIGIALFLFFLVRFVMQSIVGGIIG